MSCKTGGNRAYIAGKRCDTVCLRVSTTVLIPMSPPATLPYTTARDVERLENLITAYSADASLGDPESVADVCLLLRIHTSHTRESYFLHILYSGLSNYAARAHAIQNV